MQKETNRQDASKKTVHCLFIVVFITLCLSLFTPWRYSWSYFGQSKLTPTQQHQPFSIDIKDSDKFNALLSIEVRNRVNPFKFLCSQQDKGLWISSRNEVLSELDFRYEQSLSTLFIQRPWVYRSLYFHFRLKLSCVYTSSVD